MKPYLAWWPEAILLLWCCCIAIRQFYDKRPAWMQHVDFLGLIPSWRLFGPNAPSSDLIVYVLATNSPGDASAKIVEATPFRRNGVLNLVWNPDRRLRKSFSFHVKLLESPPSQASRIAAAEKVLLNYLFSLPIQTHGLFRQLLLVRRGSRRNARKVKVLCQSAWYRSVEPSSD